MSESWRWNSEKLQQLHKSHSYFCYAGEIQRLRNCNFKSRIVSAEHVSDSQSLGNVNSSAISESSPHHPAAWPTRLTLASASSQVTPECCVWQMYSCLLAQKFKYCGTRMITGETVCLQITEKFRSLSHQASPTASTTPDVDAWFLNHLLEV